MRTGLHWSAKSRRMGRCVRRRQLDRRGGHPSGRPLTRHGCWRRTPHAYVQVRHVNVVVGGEWDACQFHTRLCEVGGRRPEIAPDECRQVHFG